MNITAGETKYIELEITDATAEDLAGGTAEFIIDTLIKTGTLAGNVFTIKLEPQDTINMLGYKKYATRITDAQNNISYPEDLKGGMNIAKSP